MPAVPPVGKRFTKGKSGNPKGRPPLSAELKAIKELTADEIKRTIAKYFRLAKRDVEEILIDEELPSLDHLIASTICVAIKNGDISRAEYLFMRSLGKVKDVMEVVQPEPVIIRRSNGEEVSLDTRIDE
jgi:hypothetical protein